MSFEVDRYSSAWAHIALCADLTWASEPPDDFIVANQRLWAQYCRVSQVLQGTSDTQCVPNNRDSDKISNEENGCCGRRSVKDVIPESRLAQFYGNFYYDDTREKSYTSANDKSNSRAYNGHGRENSDLTECWMLPEVDYWFRKLVEEPDRSVVPRRRRQYKMLPDQDLENLWGIFIPLHSRLWWNSYDVDDIIHYDVGRKQHHDKQCHSDPVLRHLALCLRECYRRAMLRQMDIFVVNSKTASERWGSSEEASLAARVRGVRALWARAPSPPPATRKMRARRRPPRRLTPAPPPPPHCRGAPARLYCDPASEFRFDSPRPMDRQRAIGRLSASVQAAMRAEASRCPPYRGTNVTRYAPTGQRPLRYADRRFGIWWPRDNPSPKFNRKFDIMNVKNIVSKPIALAKVESEVQKEYLEEVDSNQTSEIEDRKEIEVPKQKEQVVDDQLPTTSATAVETGIRKKRLYSTVLSMSAPPPINLNAIGCVRLSQKLGTPGLIKLNPKIVLPMRIRPPVVDNKFEELEKEALEQYKASDESIDTKFRELEKEAVEQYSTSNSNTSCSSGNSTGKKKSPENEANSIKQTKFHKENTVDSVVIYSQNFPDLNAKGQTNSDMNLKNLYTPPRGEKKEQTHRHNKLKNVKNIECQRPASDTDYDFRETSTKGNHKAMRWTLHVMPPKKRHASLCVSDFSSDEDNEETTGSIKDARPCIKSHVTGKLKMSAHGGGDLRPIMRKSN